MNLFRDVSALRAQRRHELEMLHARMVTMADALESQPAQWVGEHPYIAVGGAAAIGFIAAQLPSHAARAEAAAKSAPKENSPHPSCSAAAPEAPRPSRHGEIVEILLDLAMSFFQPGSPCAGDSAAPARLISGNAGAIRGSEFPSRAGATGGIGAG